jgi:hypothetical protein
VTRYQKLLPREVFLKAIRPLALTILRVSAKTISSGTRPMFRVQVSVIDISVHSGKQARKQETTDTLKISNITVSDLTIGSPDIRFTLNKGAHSRSHTPLITNVEHLREEQRKLPYSLDGVYARIVQKYTSSSIEHTVKETSEKSGEPAMSAETSKQVVTDHFIAETFFEVFPELW